MELPLKFTGKLQKNGPCSHMYKSTLYPDIKLTITQVDGVVTIYSECNSIDIDPEILEEWLGEFDGDLDEIIKQIDEEYGEKAPGFVDEVIEQINNEQTFSHLTWNRDRQLVIYTWGKKHHKHKPHQSQCNFNAAVITGNREGLNLRKCTGLDKDVQKSVKSGVGFIKFMEFMINKIESDNLHTISINCSAGRHRCVSCAEILKQDFYPNVVIYHLDVSR